MSATSGAPLLSNLQRKAARREAREYDALEAFYFATDVRGPRRERRSTTTDPITVAPRANRFDARPCSSERAKRVRAARRAVKVARFEARP